MFANSSSNSIFLELLVAASVEPQITHNDDNDHRLQT